MIKIGIFGVPRSGTSWLGHIFNSNASVALRFQPLFSYRHKGVLSEHSSGESIEEFFEEILCSRDEFTTMISETQKNYPIFEKSDQLTHIVFKETRYLHIIENMLTQSGEIKIIGIVRNPLAVLSSWMLAPKEFKQEWDINNEWRTASSKNQGRPEEFFGYDKWKVSSEAFLQFERQFPQQFLLVRYDDLNREPEQATKRIFDFCGLEVSPQVQNFLSESKSRHDTDPYSVYRGQASDNRWKTVLPDEIVKQIKLEIVNTPLNRFL